MENVAANIELDWVEHTNTHWCGKDCDNIANRDLVHSMYDILLQNKEIRVIPSTMALFNDVQILPSFQYESTSITELNSYISILLTSQFDLATHVCSSNQFAIILKQRLLILKRIYHALLAKYHDKEKTETVIETNTSQILSRECQQSGSQALLEIGVKTGLSLLFSILKQNWQVSDILKVPSLCNSVLETSFELLQKLPPLCLSNNAQLTNLMISSLEQVSDFLKESVTHSVNADAHGRLLSCKLLLALAMQRGSLRYLLEWIEMALEASVQDRGVLKSEFFKNAILQLEGNKHVERKQVWQNDSDEEVTLYESAMNLMEILASMAVDFGGVTTSNDYCEVGVYGKSDVYVWGSNSSHQLAEGIQEKILVPVKSKMFNQVQQVSFYIMDIN